jgi:hypothetical protein
MAMWAVPGPLLFQLIAGVYLLMSLRGLGATEWVAPLTLYVISSLASIGAFYLLGPVSAPLKAILGEIQAIIVITLGVLALLCAGFLFAWKRLL